METQPEKAIHQAPQSKGTYETRPETLEIEQPHQKLLIGVPKEEFMQENRVALVPSAVSSLVANGHRVIVQKGAGKKANYSNRDYAEVGAELTDSKEEVFKSAFLVKVAPCTREEIDLLHPQQVLFSPLQIPLIDREYIVALQKKKVIAIAMEYLMDRDGSFPIVRIMSEMAGLSAILTAAKLLTYKEGGNGVLLGGISGVPPAKVVILGAGVVGEFATRTAVGLGAEVRIFDNNIYKLMRIQHRIGRQLYTSALNPVFLKREIENADVVIGAIHSKTGRSPVVVTEDMVEKMKKGSVVIDVSIDQGGCIETSRITTHDRPTFEKHGVLHYCVPNIASSVPRTASVAISNILIPILIRAGETHNLQNLFSRDSGLRHGVYIYKGLLTNAYLSEVFKLKYTNLELLITSGW